MATLTYILLLLILNYTLAEKCVIDNTPEYITWVKELMEDLDCRNNHYHAPSGNTIVNISYLMEDFDFDSETETMTIQSGMRAKWKDERLKWDPEKYHGINEADVSDYLWSPMYELFDSENSHPGYYSLYRYDLKSTGELSSHHRMHEMAQCSVKLTDWPYDMQECTFEYAQRKRSPYSGNYSVNFDFMVIEPQSAEWYINDFKQVVKDSTKNQVKVTFFLMREAVGLSAVVISPAFVLTVLSIVSLCLDVRRNVRLAIICFSLFGHYYFMKEISDDIPKECHFPPTLLLYYRGSIILSAIIVLSSFFLAAMCKLKSTPHYYIKLINDFVYENSYRNYLVLPRWDFDDATVESKASSEDWVKFANIINSVLIFCIVFAYIGLYGTKIPKRSYYDKKYYE